MGKQKVRGIDIHSKSEFKKIEVTPSTLDDLTLL